MSDILGAAFPSWKVAALFPSAEKRGGLFSYGGKRRTVRLLENGRGHAGHLDVILLRNSKQLRPKGAWTTDSWVE